MSVKSANPFKIRVCMPICLTNETKCKKVTDKTYLMNLDHHKPNEEKIQIRKLQFQHFLLSFFPRYISLNLKFTESQHLSTIMQYQVMLYG
jgi:hypothetical protein